MKKLEIKYTLKSPLSHIGESNSTTSFLNDLQIVTEDGLEEIFIYSANAFRGQWRDLGAKHLVEKLGKKLDLSSFHVLFSGGNISGSQSADIDQAREIREKLPLVSLFGGGVGNQILEGCMKVGFGYPACLEAKGIINQELFSESALSRKSGEYTSDIEFTRTDDSKGELGVRHLADVDGAGKKKKGSASTQMRYEVEHLVPGTQLYQEVFLDTNDLEEGAFWNTLQEFAKSPYLGGMSGKGFGKVDFEVYEEGELVFAAKDGEVVKNENSNLVDLYLTHLDEFILSGEEISDVLAVKKK